MLKNFFNTTFRTLWKNKTFSFLNIFGLAIGIACAGLIFLCSSSLLAGSAKNGPSSGSAGVCQNNAADFRNLCLRCG